MGNKPVRIGLRVDEKVYEAGSVMTGKVYVNVNSELKHIPVESLQLALIGEELVVVSHDEMTGNSDFDAGHHRHHNYTRNLKNVERASSSLVHMDVSLTQFPRQKLSPGQYEYPFEWELPSNLPSTMHVPKDDSHCEIHYRVMAYLKTGSGASSSWQQPTFSDSQVICIAAQPPSRTISNGTSLSLDPEEFRIHSCCFHQGSVYLGWDVDKTVASPGSNIDVGIQGGNHSKVDVQCLRATWTERISWTAHGHSEEVTRTLSKAEIPASVSFAWQSRHRGHFTGGDSSQSRVLAKLQLPPDARDTYDGRLIRVLHTLTVTAVTPGMCFVTSPESSALVRVQRKELSCSGAAVAMATPVPTAPTAYDFVDDATDYQPTMVEANLLPEDWTPQQADVVTLPVSSAVILDTDNTTASAPDESLMASTAYGTTAKSQLQLALSQSYQDPVETLLALLRDPSMVTCVQNLTPSEFVEVVICSPSKLPPTARLLAGTMDTHFTCQHVLACLWGLPPDVRFEVVRQVAPLASDLDAKQAIIEQQLDETELLHFRAALK